MKLNLTAFSIAGLLTIVLTTIWFGIASVSAQTSSVQWEDVYDGAIFKTYYNSGPRQSWHHNNCIEEQATLEKYESSITQVLCVTHGNKAALASFEGAGGIAQYALKAPGDSAYHLLANVYSPSEPVLLSNDTLLMASLRGPTNLKMLSIPDVHLKLSITNVQTGYDSYSKIYAVDETSGQIVHDANNVGAYVRHIATSANNRYAAAEVYGTGIAIVDLFSNKLKLIALEKASSYTQGQSSMRLAVSNDGKKVFVTKSNTSGHKMYIIDDFCGRSDSASTTDFEKPCDVIDMTEKMNEELGSDAPYRADFDDNSKQVSIYMWNSSVARASRITISPDFNSKRLNYLALGDSYSSGEGDTERDSYGQKYYRFSTDVKEDKDKNILGERCHVSTRSYPYRLAEGMRLALHDPKEWDSVSCSGATAWDAKLQNSHGYLGQGDRLKGADSAALKDDGLKKFIPGRQKQIEFVKKYKPRAVTLTMGGNDVGFAEKLRLCASPSVGEGSCGIALPEGRMDLGSQIRNQYDNLRDLYKELRHASAGRTKIYVLGYPQFISAHEPASCGWNIGALDHVERVMINESVSYLNIVIKQAAKSVGVKYIDVENSLNGGRLCDDRQKYVTGVTGASWPSTGDIQESFHPNAQGHFKLAMGVWDNTNSESLIDYDACTTTIESSCPDLGATKESMPTPGYFAGSAQHKDTHYKQMTSSENEKSSFMNIVLAPFTYVVDSIVNITMHSDPTNLGDFRVGSDGSFNANVVVPASLPAGYHTLIVSGRSPEGAEVQYEQVVLILGNNKDDIDEDGIDDEQQACGTFAVVSGVDADRDGVDDACDPQIEVASPPTSSPTPTMNPTPSPTLIPSPGSDGPGLTLVTIFKQVVDIIVTIISAILSVFKSFKFGWW